MLARKNDEERAGELFGLAEDDLCRAPVFDYARDVRLC